MNLLRVTDKENKLMAIIDIDRILSIEDEGGDECCVYLYTGGGDPHRVSLEKPIEDVVALINEYNINKDVENIILKGDKV
jgi:hypothetical protein